MSKSNYVELNEDAVEWDEFGFPEGNFASADWKESAEEILPTIASQLEEFGLRVETVDSGGDFYLWRIVKDK